MRLRVDITGLDRCAVERDVFPGSDHQLDGSGFNGPFQHLDAPLKSFMGFFEQPFTGEYARFKD